MTISEEIDQIIADNGGSARDAVNILLERVKQRDQTIEWQKKYIDLLEAELEEVCPMANVHGWKSTRFEEGGKIREEIYKLTQQ